MNKIKKIRIKNKLSQEDVAKKMKITQSAVAKWENGESLPTANRLSELAKLLNCTVDELLK